MANLQKELDTARHKAKQRQIDFNQVFGELKGQTVLIDIITMCHILEPAQNLDAQSLAFREGERRVGLEILKIMNVNPEKYIQIVKENIDYGIK